jgi:hypothetical protein
MKNTSFDDGLTYFISQRIHGRDLPKDLPEWATPDSEWEDADSIVEAILRWADDGGQMLDLRVRSVPEQFDNDGS